MRVLTTIPAGLALAARVASAGTIRTLILGPTDVGVLRPAVGYSTLVEFDSPLVTAVVGDQDAFRIERVATGLAVKPLLQRARSNLMVTTETGQFAFTLVAGDKGGGDYLVHVRVPAPRAETASTAKPRIIQVNRQARKRDVLLTLQSLAETEDEITLTARLESSNPKAFAPSDFAMTASSGSLPIEHLYVASLSLSDVPVSIVLVIKSPPPTLRRSLALEFAPTFLRGEKPLRVRLYPGVTKGQRKEGSGREN